MNTFNRRDFLKFAGFVLASGALLRAYPTIENGVQFFADPQVRLGNYLMRGTVDGSILSSDNEGQTWQKLVSFGEPHAILQLEQKNERIYANLSLHSQEFWLQSADGQKWYTV